ncbi:MAG: DNA polymerase III subunit delta [Actinomycetia bacterium]|nr:DNA polymerase III subunit delta [Actinomycetes bacterium]
MDSVAQQSEQVSLLPVYAIVGDQSFLRDQAVDRLRRRVEQMGDIDFNFDQFDAVSADPEQVVAAANTLPFASPYRLIIITNIHQAKKELLDALGSYAKAPSESTVLAVVGEKLIKSTALYKAIDKAGGIVERSNPKRKDLPGIVQTLFAAQQKQAALGLCAALVQSVGEDIEGLNKAVVKVATYMGERATVSPDDIEALVEISAEIKIRELTSALLRRQAADALATFNLLLKQENNINSIHRFIVRVVRELIIARSCLDSGKDSQNQIAAALGVPGWIAQRTIEGAQRYSADELRAGLDDLAQLEYRLKTSQQGEAAYQRWLLEFIGPVKA